MDKDFDIEHNEYNNGRDLVCTIQHIKDDRFFIDIYITPEEEEFIDKWNGEVLLDNFSSIIDIYCKESNKRLEVLKKKVISDIRYLYNNHCNYDTMICDDVKGIKKMIKSEFTIFIHELSVNIRNFLNDKTIT